jgi:type II secretory pathway component PulK
MMLFTPNPASRKRHPASAHGFDSSSRSGIALIIVMISITVLSILAAGFAYSMKVETKLAQNSNSEQELYWLGRSGVEYARYILAAQMAISAEPYDSLNQIWAGGPGGVASTNSVLADIQMSDVPLGNGKFSIKIVDLERKVNINTANEDMLEQAFRLVGVDAGEIGPMASAILDWIDADDSTRINGAESDYYGGLAIPYEAKNAPIDDLSELLLIRGITPDVFWGGVASNHPPARMQVKLGSTFASGGMNTDEAVFPVGLHDLFTPLSSGRININTASSEALQMIPFVDEATAAEIIRARSGPDGADGTEDDTPFQNPGELINVGLNNQVVGQITRVCDTRSRTFEVTVDADIAGYKRQFVAILGRNSPTDIQILSFYWK